MRTRGVSRGWCWVPILLIATGHALAGCEGFAKMSKSVPGYSVDCSSTGAKSAGRGYSPCLANQPMPGMALNFDFLSSLTEYRPAPAGSLPPPGTVRP